MFHWRRIGLAYPMRSSLQRRFGIAAFVVGRGEIVTGLELLAAIQIEDWSFFFRLDPDEARRCDGSFQRIRHYESEILARIMNAVVLKQTASLAELGRRTKIVLRLVQPRRIGSRYDSQHPGR